MLYDLVGAHESLIEREASASFELVLTYPRKVLSDTTETMKAADLCPQAAVIVNMLDEMPDSPE